MNINPETLEEETDEERRSRQSRTGVIGGGTTVICTPTEDPLVQLNQHRAVCLMKPYPACLTCRHKDFVLVFDANATARFDVVACPRWDRQEERIRGSSPDRYVPTEIATCQSKPFDFCKSCPSKIKLGEIGVEKVRAGWYGRWARFQNEENEE